MSGVGAGPSAELLGSLGKFGAVHHVPPPRSPSLPAVPVKKFFLIVPVEDGKKYDLTAYYSPDTPAYPPTPVSNPFFFFFVILPAVGCWGWATRAGSLRSLRSLRE